MGAGDAHTIPGTLHLSDKTTALPSHLPSCCCLAGSGQWASACAPGYCGHMCLLPTCGKDTACVTRPCSSPLSTTPSSVMLSQHSSQSSSATSPCCLLLQPRQQLTALAHKLYKAFSSFWFQTNNPWILRACTQRGFSRKDHN